MIIVVGQMFGNDRAAHRASRIYYLVQRSAAGDCPDASGGNDDVFAALETRKTQANKFLVFGNTFSRRCRGAAHFGHFSLPIALVWIRFFRLFGIFLVEIYEGEKCVLFSFHSVSFIIAFGAFAATIFSLGSGEIAFIILYRRKMEIKPVIDARIFLNANIFEWEVHSAFGKWKIMKMRPGTGEGK